jgi:hypothetical protein
MQWALVSQLVRHALLVPHMYGEQLELVAVEQLPLPLQLETAVNVDVDTGHDGVPHETDVDAWVHAPVPSHTPVLPQGGFAAQPLSAVFAATFAHAPAVAPTLHDWQVGQLPTPQQTPSVQNPEPHSLALPHGMPPPFFGMQTPPVPVQ